MANSPNIGLPFWSEGQDLPNVTHNESLLIIDILLQGRVIDRDLSAPPGSPAEGDAYIVATGGSGDWTGQDDNIAYFFGGQWNFIIPQEGWQIWVIDEVIRLTFLSGSWEIGGGAGSGSVLLMGRVNANASIALQASAVGGTFSVSHPSTGIYDITISGLTTFNNVLIDSQLNNNTAGSRSAGLKGITDKTSDSGFGAKTGFRARTFHMIQDVVYLEEAAQDQAWSFEVKEIS